MLSINLHAHLPLILHWSQDLFCLNVKYILEAAGLHIKLMCINVNTQVNANSPWPLQSIAKTCPCECKAHKLELIKCPASQASSLHVLVYV